MREGNPVEGTRVQPNACTPLHLQDYATAPVSMQQMETAPTVTMRTWCCLTWSAHQQLSSKLRSPTHGLTTHGKGHPPCLPGEGRRQ